MEKLDEAYKDLDMLQALDLPVSDETASNIAALEREYLENEILPLLKMELEPFAKSLRCGFTLNVTYNKEVGLEMSLVNIVKAKTRRKHKTYSTVRDASEQDDSFIKIDAVEKRKAAGKVICIHRKDGSVLQERDAASTFASAIVEAGLIKVRNLNLSYCGINLVSYSKNPKYGRAQREVEPGIFVLTHSNTRDKKKMLDRISDALHLGWKVEIVG